MIKRIKNYFIELKKDIAVFNKTIKLVNTFTPNYLLHAFLFITENNVPKYINIYLAARIIDEITAGRDIKLLITYVLIMICSEAILLLLSKYSWRRIRVNQIVSQCWEEVYLNRKSFSLDYSSIENPEIRSMRQSIADNRGNGGLGRFMMSLMFLYGSVLQVFISLIMMYSLFSLHSVRKLTGILKFADTNYSSVIIAVILILLTVYVTRITKKGTEKSYSLGQKIPVVQRTLHYYLDEYLDDSKAGKDVRIYDQKNIIISSSKSIFERYLSLIKIRNKVEFDMHLRSEIIEKFLMGIVYLFVGLKTLGGAFGAGGLLKYVGLIEPFVFSVMYTKRGFAELRANNLYINKFFEYMELPNIMETGEKKVDESLHNEHELEFHNVSFKYPESDEYALKNLSMKLHVGHRLAVVGMNGSGKTTMIKLLCRLYDPTEGYITLDGTDIKEYDYDEYLDLFSVVFQDFKLFSFAIGQNVAADVKYDAKRVWECLEKSGMYERVSSFKDGLETPIYKDFDEEGVEISGGEAQKIAIARALYKDAPFVILDEPTAALDPLAEYEIYSRFNDIVGDKTAVYISHRLSSCRFCHNIAVFHKGEMIQFGSHESLLEDPAGIYYELWTSQAQYYSKS